MNKMYYLVTMKANFKAPKVSNVDFLDFIGLYSERGISLKF